MLLSLVSRTVTFGSVAKTLKNAGFYTRVRVCLTTSPLRNFAFGNHAKAEMSALYHTFIAARPLDACKARTCQMMGMSVLKYFKSLFSEIAKGRTDYENMLPMTIGLCKAV